MIKFNIHHETIEYLNTHNNLFVTIFFLQFLNYKHPQSIKTVTETRKNMFSNSKLYHFWNVPHNRSISDTRNFVSHQQNNKDVWVQLSKINTLLFSCKMFVKRLFLEKSQVVNAHADENPNPSMELIAAQLWYYVN